MDIRGYCRPAGRATIRSNIRSNTRKTTEAAFPPRSLDRGFHAEVLMKLAEALQERADIQKRLAQLKSRLRNNARVQDGERPSEMPEDLLRELDMLVARLEELMTRINLTNAKTLDEGLSLTALIAKRDCLRTRVGLLRDFLEEASDLSNRALRSEIKIKSTVSVVEKRKALDKLSQELRQIDTRIQQRNWLTELL